jgi:hypothetical protein
VYSPTSSTGVSVLATVTFFFPVMMSLTVTPLSSRPYT